MTFFFFFLRLIELGTNIINNCWMADNTELLGCLGYTHETVDYSWYLKDAVIGAYTNTIEATWGAIKRSLPEYGTSNDL
jgi:hypothetical protein